MESGPQMTVDELAAKVGMSVRTVRFYAGKGLLPPPQLRGRLGLYGEAHLARLELIRELQDKGFTLAAIQRYLERVPADATADDIAVFRALMSPWVVDEPEQLPIDRLAEVAGRPLDGPAIDRLEALGVLRRLGDGVVEVRRDELELGLELLDVDAPLAMLVEARELLDRHTDEMAEAMASLLRRHLVRPYLTQALPESDRAQLSRVIEQLKPLTVRTVVTAFQRAVDRVVRGRVEGEERSDRQRS